MAKKKKEKKIGASAAPAKVRAKVSAKRVADRKAAIKVPAAKRKGSPQSGRSRSRGSGK
tara:strand:+ start:1492 stop:1668 length:177 start_codon:yes stop_codon:yes gene_type:complete